MSNPGERVRGTGHEVTTPLSNGRTKMSETTTEVAPSCWTYRFGQVLVEVCPVLVVIIAPYSNPSHEDFCKASRFVERYTHAVDATVIEDDGLGLELHVYPNTENLIIGPGPYPPVGADPRVRPVSQFVLAGQPS
jgi:hypothetical protein